MKVTMTESKTPETEDALLRYDDGTLAKFNTNTIVTSDFARQLEISRDEWRKLADDTLKALNGVMGYNAHGYYDQLNSRFRELQQKDGK